MYGIFLEILISRPLGWRAHVAHMVACAHVAHMVSRRRQYQVSYKWWSRADALGDSAASLLRWTAK
eukprot:3081041-Prymnesium_polylepis.1